MKTIVIVGHNIRDAQALAMQRRESDRGHRVRLVSASVRTHRLPVQSVDEWHATDYAREHPNWLEVQAVLQHAHIQTGAPTTSE